MANINIKVLRARYGKSQSEMAELLGLSVVGYHRKENGRNPFTLEEARKISELFGLPIEIIFFTEIVHGSGTADN